MFTIPRGASRSFTITVADAAGVAVSLVGAKIYFTVRVADAVILAKANTAGGGSDAQIEVMNAAGGIFKLKLLNADTTREPVTGTCDGWVVTAGGEYLQVIPNQPFQITQSQTRSFPVV